MKGVDAQPTETLASAPPVARSCLLQSKSDIAMSLVSNKIRDWHLHRKAIVYIRQSTPQQVLEHRESTDRQYSLVDRAKLLGWAQDRVEVIDEDQGHSGQTAAGRLGFQYLLAEIGLDHIGIIFGLEMSRLARSNKDWHQLLELCALFRTLLADQDGVYDPTDYNDRLLLGLKGTLSEAELHILRSRMYQGLLNKAKRGEVFNHPPLGYIKLPTGEFALDPDEQVQGVVRLLFAEFERQGTLHGLLRYLVQHGIRLPIRPHFGPNRGRARVASSQSCHVTKPAASATLCGLLSVGPSCRGSASEDRRAPGHRTYGAKARRVSRPFEGPVPGLHHGGAILGQSATSGCQQHGSLWSHAKRTVVAGGSAGCGRCGRRLMVAYTNAGTGLRYSCARGVVDYAEPVCQSLSGQCLDTFIRQQILAALQPAAVELHLAAAANVEQERQRLHQQRRQECERARYETERAAAVSSCRTGKSARGSGVGTALGSGYPKAATGTRRLRAFLP